MQHLQLALQFGDLPVLLAQALAGLLAVRLLAGDSALQPLHLGLVLRHAMIDARQRCARRGTRGGVGRRGRRRGPGVLRPDQRSQQQANLPEPLRRRHYR